jgi:hypothetical protein
LEARAEFRQPRISKGLVAIVAVSVALGLGVMAGTIAKNNGSAATTTQTHSISQGLGGPANGTVRHGGMQTVEENAAPRAITGVSPDSLDRNAVTPKLSGNAFVAPDAADHKLQTAPSKSSVGFAPVRGYREG